MTVPTFAHSQVRPNDILVHTDGAIVIVVRYDVIRRSLRVENLEDSFAYWQDSNRYWRVATKEFVIRQLLNWLTMTGGLGYNIKSVMGSIHHLRSCGHVWPELDAMERSIRE